MILPGLQHFHYGTQYVYETALRTVGGRPIANLENFIMDPTRTINSRSTNEGARPVPLFKTDVYTDGRLVVYRLNIGNAIHIKEVHPGIWNAFDNKRLVGQSCDVVHLFKAMEKNHPNKKVVLV